MQPRKLVAILLIAAGTLGLLYGSITYRHDEHAARVGSLEFSVARRDRIDVPAWVSVGLIVVGTALLASGEKR